MYNKILVPLDGSKRAEAILGHVEELALHGGKELILMQVVEPVHVSGPRGLDMDMYVKLTDQKTEQAKEYLTGLEGTFRKKGIETHVHVTQGPVVEAILNAAQARDVDLIAIASHGRGGLSQLFYGSVAVGVLHRADRPLLVVRSV